LGNKNRQINTYKYSDYLFVCVSDKAGGTQNGGYYAVDSRQRLLAEEAELDRMVKELQASLPPSEGLIMLEPQLLHTALS